MDVSGTRLAQINGLLGFVLILFVKIPVNFNFCKTINISVYLISVASCNSRIVSLWDNDCTPIRVDLLIQNIT